MWHKHVIRVVDGFRAEVVRRHRTKNILIFQCSYTVTPSYKTLKKKRSDVEGGRWNPVWERDYQGRHVKDMTVSF